MSWGEAYAHPLTNTTCQKNETWIPFPKEHWHLFKLTGVCRALSSNEELFIPCGTYERWVPVPPLMQHRINTTTLCDSNIKVNENLVRVESQTTSVLPTSIRCTPYPATLIIALLILLILSLLLNVAFVLLTVILGRF